MGDLLTESRAEAPDELVEKLARRVHASRRPFAARRALAAVALSAALAVLLGLAGGVSYAGTLAAEFVHVVDTVHQVFVGSKLSLTVKQNNAAMAQYGTTPTTTTTTTPAGPTAGAGGEVTTAVATGSSGSVTATSPDGTNAATVQWAPTTFSAPVVIVVDPTPPVTATALVGSGNQLVSITVTDPTTGAIVHDLAAPLEIVFKSPSAGFVPVISEDGLNFRALKKLSGTSLPDGVRDGYYIDGDGDVHILTRHVTVFAVLFKANVNVSESGRKTPAAGSGKFGDPTRNHVGSPLVKRTYSGRIAARARGTQGWIVPITLFIDEQASIRFAVFAVGGEQAQLAMKGSTVRGHALAGKPARNLKIVVLRPGTIRFGIRVQPGQLESGTLCTLRVWAVDFDGNRTVRNVRFVAG